MTPRLLLAAVTLALGRRDWGHAMLAELEQVRGRRARWRFAAGCVRAQVVTLPAITACALAAGFVSAAIVVVALVRYPGIVTGVGTWVAVACFGGLVVGYVVVTAHLGARLAESRLVLPAVAVGVAIACSWMVVGLSASLAWGAPVSMTLLVLGPAVALLAGWWATAHSRSQASGVACVGLASLVAGFALFILWAGQTVAFAGRPYDAGQLRDFAASGAPDLATYAVNDSLGSGMVLLLLVPLVSVAAGLAGSAVGVRRTRAGVTTG
jgi:hypothetical protein